MYISFYKLSEKPFNISTDPRFLWRGEKHLEALANLKYGLLEANGYVVLTGDVGTGKTTLVNALVETLDDSVLVANINHPTLDTIEFLNLVAKTYDASVEITSKNGFIFFFNSFLQKTHTAGKVVLLVIDEAHRLSTELLEEIRLLSNMEQAGRKLINIFFVGQSELKGMLLSPHCRALRQRITLFYDIEPLSEDETSEYVAHRLKVAGTEEELFKKEAIKKIHIFSRGYPRLINIICDRALLTGYVKEQREIDADIVNECAREVSFLDPKASNIQMSQIDRFSSWGRPLVEKLRTQTAAIRNKHPLVDESIKNKLSPTANRLKESATQIVEQLRGKYRYSMISIGLAVVIALIIAAIGIGVKTESAVKKEAPVELDKTSNMKETDGFKNKGIDGPNQKETKALTQEPEKSAAPSVAEKSTEAPRLETQKPNTDQIKSVDKENVAVDSDPIEPARQSSANRSPAVSERPKLLQPEEIPSDKTLKQELPNLPQPTTLELASAALKQKKYQTAIDLIEAERSRTSDSSLEARQIYSNALVGRADQVATSSPHEAETMLQKAIETNPKNVQAYHNLGKIYTRSKDYALAIDAYQTAVTLNPKLSDAFFNLGFIYATTGMYEDAEKLFSRVVQLEPPYIDKALFNLAVIQEKLGKKEECMANLQMALMIRPDNQKAQTYLKQLVSAEEEIR